MSLCIRNNIFKNEKIWATNRWIWAWAARTDHKKCLNNRTRTLCNKPNPSLATPVRVTQWARALGKNLNVSMEIKASISLTGPTLALMESTRASYRTIRTTKRTSTHVKVLVVEAVPRTSLRCKPFRNSIVGSSSPRSSTVTKIWCVSLPTTSTRKTSRWDLRVVTDTTLHSMMASSSLFLCSAKPLASSTLQTWMVMRPPRTRKPWWTTSCLKGNTWRKLPRESSAAEIFQIFRQTRSKVSSNCLVITREYPNPAS